MYEKYVEALRLMDECVKTKQFTQPETGWGAPYGIRGLHPCIPAWDACFDFIFANFAKPQTGVNNPPVSCDSIHAEVKLVKSIIDGTYKTGGAEIEDLLRGIPPSLCEEIFPVCVARYLLRDMWMPFDLRKSATFSQFHLWYGTMILSC